MSKKLIWIPLLLVTAILISGCTTSTDLIPKTNLPPGFTYVAVHSDNSTIMDIGGSLVNYTEGIYKYSGDDLYIQVIESDNPQALLTQYKEQIQKQFKTAYNPFTTISINGHDATQVTDFDVVKGEQKQDYAIVWATGKEMILVASPTADLQTVMTLANATKA